MSSCFLKDTGDEAFFSEKPGTRKGALHCGICRTNHGAESESKTHKDNDKSQRKGKTTKNNTWSKDEIFIFATALSSLDERDKPWALVLRNLALKKK